MFVKVGVLSQIFPADGGKVVNSATSFIFIISELVAPPLPPETPKVTVSAGETNGATPTSMQRGRNETIFICCLNLLIQFGEVMELESQLDKIFLENPPPAWGPR